jgi:hypothetical protein
MEEVVDAVELSKPGEIGLTNANSEATSELVASLTTTTTIFEVEEEVVLFENDEPERHLHGLVKALQAPDKYEVFICSQFNIFLKIIIVELFSGASEKQH